MLSIYIHHHQGFAQGAGFPIFFLTDRLLSHLTSSKIVVAMILINKSVKLFKGTICSFVVSPEATI